MSQKDDVTDTSRLSSASKLAVAAMPSTELRRTAARHALPTLVGSDDGSPVFVLDAKSPRSAVNNLGLSINWSTDDRTEAANFLRKLADKLEEGTL